MYADFTIKDKFPYIDTEKGGTEDYKLIGYKVTILIKYTLHK